MKPLMATDPFTVLGVSPDADEAEVRAHYLELVKLHPPERDPEKFQEIRRAYEAAKDPLAIAKHLIAVPSDNFPSWADVLDAQAQNPPKLSVSFLLSLGNRSVADPVPDFVSEKTKKNTPRHE